MRHTAVMQFIRDLRKVKFIVQEQLFYLFNFMDDDELLYGDTFHFGK